MTWQGYGALAKGIGQLAKNGAKGGGRRGAIRERTQFKLPSGHHAKRNTRTGEIISVKADLKPYKGVVMERNPPVDLPNATPQIRLKPGRANLLPIPGRAAWHLRPQAGKTAQA